MSEVVARPWLGLSVVLAAIFMDLVDVTIVNIALPRIQADLGAGYATAQWVLAGYTLAFALVLITGGRLGDIYGRKRIFLIGIVGFTVASAACGAAPSAGVLVGARLAQGVLAALMVPQVMSVVMIMFRDRQRVRAFGLYGAVLSLANVSGPVLGALLTEYGSWRTIFLVNVPVGVLASIGAVLFMPESRSDRPLRPDLTGIGLIALASFALMFPLIQGRELGWPPWMVGLLVLAAPLFALFGVVQRRRDGSALVPPSLFRARSFTRGLVALLVLFSGLASFFLVVAYLGWPPLHTALIIAGWPVGIVLANPVAQRFGATHGRRLVVTGLAVMTGGMVTLIAVLDGGADVWVVTLPVLVMGTGMGLCVSVLTGAVLAGVPARDTGAGSGVVNAALQFGGALGVAIVGLIFFGLSAGTNTLWYNAGAFLLALLLTPREIT